MMRFLFGGLPIPPGTICAVPAHYATDDELADTQADSSVYKERSTTSLVNEEEDNGGEDDE